jgi:UDP-N-acetyl-D-galactosamine dehydrogenase
MDEQVHRYRTGKRNDQGRKNIINTKVLIMGITFKENVSDIRNSKIADIVDELKSYGIEVDIIDPYADAEEVMEEYGITMKQQPGNNYDAIIAGVAHNQYLSYTEENFLKLGNEHVILFDVKGIYRGKCPNIRYMSL